MLNAKKVDELSLDRRPKSLPRMPSKLVVAINLKGSINYDQEMTGEEGDTRLLADLECIKRRD